MRVDTILTARKTAILNIPNESEGEWESRNGTRLMSKNQYLKEARERLLKGIKVPEKSKFIVDDFQKEAIDAVAGGEDTLVVAPTGAGKTYIAMEAIAVALGMNSKAVYTTPLKALSNGKYTELKKKFEPEYKVGLLTGDRKIDTDAQVVVATTEIYRNELYSDDSQYGVVVLDEVHFISDLQRGPVWEESIILTHPDSTLLMLSASISNAQEIAEWLHEVRGRPCRVVIKKERPVELRLGFLHPDLGVLPLTDEKGAVFKEVSHFYGDAGLDGTGMKFSGKKGSRDKKSRRKGGGKHSGGSRRGKRRK